MGRHRHIFIFFSSVHRRILCMLLLFSYLLRTTFVFSVETRHPHALNDCEFGGNQIKKKSGIKSYIFRKGTFFVNFSVHYRYQRYRKTIFCQNLPKHFIYFYLVKINNTNQNFNIFLSCFAVQIICLKLCLD